jgi:NAD(P)-dependent dehydrogenase (short-subunit alcohol dehydrogenase family)
MAKTIVITGSSDGIGAAAARQLHQDGHQVVIVGRSRRKTQAVAREIGADHFLVDFTRLREARELAARLDAAYPRIDVLANYAGAVSGDRTDALLRRRRQVPTLPRPARRGLPPGTRHGAAGQARRQCASPLA